jgi:Ca2+-binding EF-hand superfamily protein
MSEVNPDSVLQALLGNEEEITKLTNQAFDETDTDHSGEVSLDEFFVAFGDALKSLGLPVPSREQSLEVFNSLDTDKSGRLDRQEFRAFVVQVLQSMVALLSATD